MKQNVLPIHGFVLAGGKSTRMGRDKAVLSVGGRSMVATAAAKLNMICSVVSIAGNRSDLGSIAPVVHEHRTDAGPAAGIEAGVRSSCCRWSLFMPVDVPLIPAALLRGWASAVLDGESDGVRLSYLRTRSGQQPAFCLVHQECRDAIGRVLDDGERRLALVFERIASSVGPTTLWIAEAEKFLPPSGASRDTAVLFRNVNTPEDLASLEKASGDGLAPLLGCFEEDDA